MAEKLKSGATGVLALADGTIIEGIGAGAVGEALGEVCFNTAMTGYQEILTDPSYMAQIVAFTFPHVGNTGVNVQDVEGFGDAGAATAARGAIFRDLPTPPANWRADADLDGWLKRRGVVALAGVDTRALTLAIREKGMPHAVIAHNPDGVFDLPALTAKAREWKGLEGLDLAKDATCLQPFTFDEGLWAWPDGYDGPMDQPKYDVVVVDFGIKRNILRALTSVGARAHVVPAKTSAEEILARKPDGVLFSNGPGDPAATGVYAVPTIQAILERGIPLFGICLGHQILALALGGKTAKMPRGHRGANHPVKDIQSGRVDITSQNHGFMVLPETLPASVEVTHVSLFDGSNEGLRLKDKPAFSIQYHPEASPGPHDSHYLFKRFVEMIEAHKASRKAA